MSDPVDEIFKKLMPAMEKAGLKPFAILSIPRDTSGFDGNFYPDYVIRMCYIDEQKGGPLPVREECRDNLDFEYKLESWMARAKVYSPKYATWEALIDGETKRLENEYKK